MDEKIYWLAWHIVLAGQARKFWAIMKYFGTPKTAWLAPDSEFDSLTGSHHNKAGKMLERRKNCDLFTVASYLNNNKMSVLFYTDNRYPEQLKNIYDPPPVLFVSGRADCLNDTTVALVGARKATPYGLSVAENLARELAGAGVTVVSGMARGIDAAAHRGALDAGGKTIAVLGCGVDVVYPRENGRLMGNIMQNGAVISEFPPGTPPDAWHFPVRNRIISGLSKAVVVVEAARRSGALITAHVALDQGRDVMAVPGNITSKLSRGPNELIKQGAAPVLDAGDIIEELGLVTTMKPVMPGESAGGLKLNDNEKLLLKLLNFEAVSLENIVQKSGLGAGEVMSALMFLEVKGLVRQLPGRQYVLMR
ncbi:DNA-processing protein DprA [Desulfallas thermosapovorans]|uniref:DNA processing protein n=1 Tax=Desulfallas thermosapovorans DSM 6562 TaxID=1121431 RepID=A0A5S4ZXU6_9FIRM|nr:DNA-processing protein DprA [Desulfallas thermosapovorans]TYO97914.1 DNA processing protein [Desulfallas thermosapovorans DSM 6562]